MVGSTKSTEPFSNQADWWLPIGKVQQNWVTVPDLHESQCYAVDTTTDVELFSNLADWWLADWWLADWWLADWWLVRLRALNHSAIWPIGGWFDYGR